MKLKKQVEDKVYNIDLLVEDMKILPHTYNTILETDVCLNITILTILRRKLNKLCNQGFIYKTAIPGTRSGKILFFHPKKEYKIYIVSERTGSDVYVSKEHEIIEKQWIRFSECKILSKTKWIEKKNVTIYESRILTIL